MDKSQLLSRVVDISRAAGSAILHVYNRGGDLKIENKRDDSPVTQADLAAHGIICPALEGLLEGVPVLSEESEIPAYDVRAGWHRYWIVDPLDGTKEFIKRNGEFTVNIALIERGEPVLGVVYVPVTGVTYAGVKGQGAFKLDRDGKQAIQVRSMRQRGQTGEPVVVVASRRHGTDKVDQLIAELEDELGAVATTNMGSSLKLCLIAEGKADFYPRLAPTSEWDTAAAQAVVEAAGGIVVDTRMDVLRYNTKEELLNPFFYVIADSQFDWAKYLK